MFSGIGGFEKGIYQAYENNRRTKQAEEFSLDGGTTTSTGYRDKQPACVGCSEIDKYAIQIYQRHFPTHRNFGDARTIKPADIPDFDLLCGGFPCQAFSIAGKRGGFDDTRGTLFFEIARILRAKRPSLLLLENVKGLLSHDRGRTFDTIIRTLDGLGYDLQWQVLNSKNFGVPQNRERVFIVGHLRGTSRPQVFPLGENDGVRDGQGQVANTLTANYFKGPAASRTLIEMTQEQSQGYRVYNPDGLATSIASQAGGVGAKTGLYAIPEMADTLTATIKPEISGRDGIKICDTRGFDKPKSWHYPKIYGKVSSREIEILETILKKRRVLNKNTDGGAISLQDIQATNKECDYLVEKGYLKKIGEKYDLYRTSGRIQDWVGTENLSIRRLTPVECARLQGFPDDWHKGLSDTQAYKCYGNAVTVNVIEFLINRIFSV